MPKKVRKSKYGSCLIMFSRTRKVPSRISLILTFFFLGNGSGLTVSKGGASGSSGKKSSSYVSSTFLWSFIFISFQQFLILHSWLSDLLQFLLHWRLPVFGSQQ